MRLTLLHKLIIVTLSHCHASVTYDFHIFFQFAHVRFSNNVTMIQFLSILKAPNSKANHWLTM